ncbi:MAG: glycosyltransferase, partial [Candidatus Thorarchaeota archaeon]
MRWIDDSMIEFLGLDKLVTKNNALYKVHGSEARFNRFPECLIEWQTNWRYLPVPIVSCMDNTVTDVLEAKTIYHIERPLDFSIMPKSRIEKDELTLFHAPTNSGAQKGTDKFREIVKKVKGLKTVIVENTEYDECQKIRAKSSAVFDQFPSFVGTYGMSAVESWYLKLPVFTGLKTWAFAYHPEIHDFVIQVNEQTLFHELKQFVEDPNPYWEKGKKAYKYVKDVHNPDKIALQYRALIESIRRK